MKNLLLIRDKSQADLERVLRLRLPAATPTPPPTAAGTAIQANIRRSRQKRSLRGRCGFRGQPRRGGCHCRRRLKCAALRRLFEPHHPFMTREEDPDVLLMDVAARDLNQPDLLQLGQVPRQLPLIITQSTGLHLEVNLNCTAGVGLLCQRRVSQLRPRADLLSRQQPVRHESPGKVAVDVKVSFHQIPPSQVETAQLYFPLTLSSYYALPRGRSRLSAFCSEAPNAIRQKNCNES